MSHIANQRIKKDGKYYAAGDPITLNDEEITELPDGAVSPKGDFAATLADAAVKLHGVLKSASTAPDVVEQQQQAALQAAVSKLKSSAFKQDGEIRAGALKGLNDQLDFDVTVQAVVAAQAVLAGGKG